MKKVRNLHFASVFGVVLSLSLVTPVLADNTDSSGNGSGSDLFKYIVLAIMGVLIYRLNTKR
jgi:hypothetical protein